MIYRCLQKVNTVFEFKRGKYDSINDEFVLDKSSPDYFYGGTITEDLTHLKDSHIDLSGIEYSIIIVNDDFKINKNDFVKVNGEWVKISNLIKYRKPLKRTFGTYVVLI